MLDWLRILGCIIFVDLVLSGNNALAIGTIVAGVRPHLRWFVLMVAGAGVILLRLVLTSSMTLLLQIPYFEFIGGATLLVIALRLLAHHDNQGEEAAKERSASALPRYLRFVNLRQKLSLPIAMLAILNADATSSFDNIMAVAALARDNIPLLIIGLNMSIPLLMIGSAFIASIMQRLPWLTLVASVVMASAAAQLMSLQNPLDLLRPLLHFSMPSLWWTITVYVVIACMLLYGSSIWFLKRFSNQGVHAAETL